MLFQLTITGNDDGTITVHGPITQKILCWGMLVQAMFIINAVKVDQNKIITPTMIPPGMIQGGKGGVG
ncbi:MAG: hypothetical protein A2Z69_00365 [Bacteroidetes bacterium RBG_13_44_24]|nr:MAG: hypothetical protein A2Z69_00365 [Bacteroidetes bacterium RBG_13_44_24]